MFKDKLKKTDKKLSAMLNVKMKRKRRQFCYAPD